MKVPLPADVYLSLQMCPYVCIDIISYQVEANKANIMIETD